MYLPTRKKERKKENKENNKRNEEWKNRNMKEINE